jgi:transcription antitermination factor NusG
MDDDTWHLVKHTNKVTGFVGGASNRPRRSPKPRCMKIVNQMQEGVDKPQAQGRMLMVGELVRVKEGPFTDFNGAVEEVNYERARSACRSRSSAVPRRWSWTSRRSRRPEPFSRRGLRRHLPC